MIYEAPKLIEHGSIAQHTFTNAGGGEATWCNGVAVPPKDTQECHLDCFSEWSCS
jgi:hypothetical protein